MFREIRNMVRLVVSILLLTTPCLPQFTGQLAPGFNVPLLQGGIPEVEYEAPEFEAPEPGEPFEFEPPEDPCPCSIRCCTHVLEPRRPSTLMNFDMPGSASFDCCGCFDCPPFYFFVPVSSPFAVPMVSSVLSPTG